MATEKSEVIATIRRLVAEAREIPGSRLAMDLKVAIPDWSAETFGARSLRDFIVNNVRGVVIAGNSGMDVVYSTSTATRAEPADAWRAWVSPNSPFHLAVDVESGEAVLIKRGATVPEGHVLVAPATIDEHRAIAREFLAEVPESNRDVLRKIVDSPDEHWWRRWRFKLTGLNRLGVWSTFRHERLRELLDTRLSASVLSETARSAATEIAERRGPRKRSGAPQRAADLRVVVAAVIEKMTEEDLRDIKLPVGLLLDVLDEMKS